MGAARAKLPSPGSNWTSRNTSARCFRMCRASTLAPCTLRPERSRNARLERDQDPLVDQAYVVDDAPCFLERFEVGVIQKNRRKADQK